jgi:hypothetical protein
MHLNYFTFLRIFLQITNTNNESEPKKRGVILAVSFTLILHIFHQLNIIFDTILHYFIFCLLTAATLVCSDGTEMLINALLSN